MQLAADWVKDSAVRISESVAVDILEGCPGRPSEQAADTTSDLAEEMEPIAASKFPVRHKAQTRATA